MEIYIILFNLYGINILILCTLKALDYRLSNVTIGNR